MVSQTARELAESFEGYFGCIQDPRTRDVEHDLEDILFLAVCATIAGADGPSDIESFGISKEAWLKRHIPLRNGIPSHDTIGRVLSLIKPSEFQEAFLGWIGSFRLKDAEDSELQLVNIDGKTLRNSGTLSKRPLHLVSAWASEYGLSLGQVAVDQKSNEITAIPELLHLLELRGATVTIDAMGTQKDIAKQIIQDGGNYCLALKGNHPKMHEAVSKHFDEVIETERKDKTIDRHSTVEKSRGREEVRSYIVSSIPESMADEAKAWKGLTSIGMATTVTEHNGIESVESRYYLMSAPLTAKQFARAVREHWQIESMHWMLDVTFREDASQITNGHGPENFGFLRRFVISLLKRDTSKGSLRGKRKQAAWNTDFLESVLKII